MIILDLDNCIADDRARIPLIRWDLAGDARYHAYHLALGEDPLANEHLFRGWEPNILIFTGRPTAYRAATMCWLERHRVAYRHLLMRNPNDPRSSAQVKLQQLAWVEDYYGIYLPAVHCAYDDREDICAMYRTAGVRAERVAIHDVCAYTNPLTKEAHA